MLEVIPTSHVSAGEKLPQGASEEGTKRQEERQEEGPATRVPSATPSASCSSATALVAKSIHDNAAVPPGQVLMRLLQEDGGGRSQVPPEYAQALARLCDTGHPLALWAARYMAIKVCGCSPHTVAAKGRDLATFIRWFVEQRGHGDIGLWIERDTRRFLSHLQDSGRKTATINRHLYTLGHFARWVHAQPGAVFAGYGLPVQDVAPLPMEEPACRKLSGAELEALFAAARKMVAEQKYTGPQSRRRPRRNLALLGMLYYTGVRISEALSLKRHQYDGEKLFAVRCKGRRSRNLLVHPQCARLLDDYLERERSWDAVDALDDTNDSGLEQGRAAASRGVTVDASRPLFLTRNGTAIDRNEANRILRQIAEAAGEFDGKSIAVHAHRLRHTFGARYREASGSDTETAAAMGHAGLGHVGRYVRSTDTERSTLLQRALEMPET